MVAGMAPKSAAEGKLLKGDIIRKVQATDAQSVNQVMAKVDSASMFVGLEIDRALVQVTVVR